MPDWQAVVRGNLQGLRLDPASAQAIAAELAGHLEDLFQEFLAQGLCEAAALRRCMKEVTDWPGLVKQIQRAKREEEIMNTRTKQFWFPGFVNLASAIVIWAILERMALQRVLNMEQMALVIYLPWLVLLPGCGAAGAHLSQRAGGSRLARMAAGLLPAMVMIAYFALILITMPFEFLHDHHTPFVIQHPLYFMKVVLASIAIPGVALLLGAMPFLGPPKTHAS